ASDLVYDAELHTGLRENGCDGLREALQAIDTGDEDIFHTTLLQVGQHRKPELGAFTLGEVKADQVLAALDINTENVIHRTGLNRPVVPDFVGHTVQKHKGVNGIQRAAAPFTHRRKHTVGDTRYFRSRNLHGIHLTDVIADGTCAHASGIHAQYVALQFLGDDQLPFGNNLRLKRAFTVTAGLQFKATAAHTPDRLFALTVAPVGYTGRFFLIQMILKLTVEHRLQ